MRRRARNFILLFTIFSISSSRRIFIRFWVCKTTLTMTSSHSKASKRKCAIVSQSEAVLEDMAGLSSHSKDVEARCQAAGDSDVGDLNNSHLFMIFYLISTKCNLMIQVRIKNQKKILYLACTSIVERASNPQIVMLQENVTIFLDFLNFVNSLCLCPDPGAVRFLRYRQILM